MNSDIVITTIVVEPLVAPRLYRTQVVAGEYAPAKAPLTTST